MYIIVFIEFYNLDNKIRSQVAIIDDSLAVKGFGREDVVGEKISLKTWKGTYKFTIIGVTKNPNALFETMFGDTFPAFVFVPLSTLHKLVGSEEIDSYSLTVNDDKLLDRTALELKALLEMKHSNKDKYLVENTMKNAEDVNQILGQITAFISFVAAISLLVGGIAVMNIMLVTVTERTKEIGIRKSIGAKNKDILIQFLIESVILTGIGGIIGMLVGYFGGVLIGSFMNIFPIMSPKVIIMTVIISSSIGIVFGVYPARKAAKLDPIEALRYE